MLMALKRIFASRCAHFAKLHSRHRKGPPVFSAVQFSELGCGVANVEQMYGRWLKPHFPPLETNSSEDCREKGNQCMKEERYIEAMFHYTHGVKLEPRNAYLYSNRSLAFLRMQQFYHALEDANTTIQLMPKWPKGYYRKGEIECAAEHYKEAIESFKQGLQVKPDETNLKEAVIKATYLYQLQRQSDGRILWYGIGLGVLVGILLNVIDDTVSKPPLLQNDVLRVLVVLAVCLACYGIALLYRWFLRSQRACLLESPPDLLGDDEFSQRFLPDLSSNTANNHPSSSSLSADPPPQQGGARAARWVPKPPRQRKKH